MSDFPIPAYSQEIPELHLGAALMSRDGDVLALLRSKEEANTLRKLIDDYVTTRAFLARLQQMLLAAQVPDRTKVIQTATALAALLNQPAPVFPEKECPDVTEGEESRDGNP